MIDRIFALVTGLLIGTSVLASEKVNSIEGEVPTEIEIADRRDDCSPKTDIWNCESPAITSTPRIIEWEENRDEVAVELGLSNFEHALIEEIDGRTNDSIRIVWEKNSDTSPAEESYQISILRSPIAGRTYRLTVRNPHNRGNPLVQEIPLPGIRDSYDLDLSIFPINSTFNEALTPLFPVPGDFLCDIVADPWSCKQPTIHGLVIPDRDRKIIDSDSQSPMGEVLKLGVTVENAARVVVESLNYPLYSPLTLLDHSFFPTLRRSDNRGKKTVNFQMQVFKQKDLVRIRAINKHGSVSRDEIIQVKFDMVPSIANAGWADRAANNLTISDSDQTVYLALSRMKFADSAKLTLYTANHKCDGSFFLESSKSSHLFKLGRMLGASSTYVRVPVILKNCPGESYTLTALVSPGQVDWFPEWQKRLSTPLKVNSLVMARPRIVRSSLEEDGKSTGLPEGSFYAGARLRLNVEAVDTDELIVMTTSNDVITSAVRQLGIHVNSYFPLVADHRIDGGLDLIARTPNNPRSDMVRFRPRVVRQARLTVPVIWNTTSTPSTTKASITCALHPKGSSRWASFFATKTISVNRQRTGNETVVFDLEGPARAFQKPGDAVSITCNATGEIPGQGLGTMTEDTKYTFGSWPVGRVTLTSKGFVLRMP